jgi:hypothetical protein
MPRVVRDIAVMTVSFLTQRFGHFRRTSWRSGERPMLIPTTNGLQVLTDSCLIINDPIYFLFHAPSTLTKEIWYAVDGTWVGPRSYWSMNLNWTLVESWLKKSFPCSCGWLLGYNLWYGRNRTTVLLSVFDKNVFLNLWSLTTLIGVVPHR